MNIPVFSYEKQPDGSFKRTVAVEPVDPAKYQLHEVPNLPGVIVGVRYEKNGKTIIPEEGQS